jgi:hypothetical protein
MKILEKTKPKRGYLPSAVILPHCIKKIISHLEFPDANL